MPLRDASLSIKVALVVLVAALVPIGLMGALTWSQARALLTDSIHENLASHADRVAEEIDSFNETWQAQAATLGSARAVQALARGSTEDDEKERAHELFDAVTNREPRLRSLSVVDASGQVLLSSVRGLEGTSVKGRAWYPDAQGGKTLLAEFVVLPGSNEVPVLEYSQPLPNGAFLLVTVHADSFWASARKLSDRVWKGSYAVVLDNNGVRLAHGTRPDLIYRPSGPLRDEVKARALSAERFGTRTSAVLEPIAEPLEYDWATAPTAGTRDLRRYDDNGAGQGKRLATARRMHSVPWTVVSVVPEEAVNQPVSTLLAGLVVRAAIVLAVAFFISWFFARRAVKPLRALIDAARDFAKGVMPKPIPVDSRDEIGELATQFNAMTTALSENQAQLEARVKARTIDLTRANDELTAQQEELKVQQEELETKNREVARADQLKSAFLANMSHELRTPLNSVIGFSELLGEELGGTLSDRHRRYLGDVRASGKHLLTLINDILDLSKIEAGHLELHLETLNAAEALTQARALVGGVALSKSVKILEDRRSTRSINADAEKLQQVLANLAGNAVKFSPAGSEVVLGVEDRGDLVRFFVKDNGPGIEPSLLPRLFEPFVQGENPLVKRHQGTGLGLAITRRLLERHGVSLEVDTKPGFGSTFSFSMLATKDVTPRVMPELKKPMVLLVEADQRRAKGLREALSDAGYDVSAGFEGEIALDAARRVKPQVLVISPSEDAKGIAALKALREDPVMKKVPVVLTNAAHALGVLPKPLEADEVVEAVRRATRHGGGKVLAVDDDPRALELLRATLTPRGYEVQTADSAMAALEMIRRAPPDVVLTDLLMPVMSGFELVDTLAADPKLRSIPVLVLTALDLSAEQRERLKRHVAATARKGDITATEVVEAVGRLTRGAPATHGPRGTVLVVDDHDLNRELARALLERRGFGVIEAEDGEKSVHMARSHNPQLILMDIAMPGMDGFGALEALRADPKTKGIPVVALTALAMKTDQDAVMKAGFDGYVTKPVDAMRLDMEVDRVLSK